MNPPRRPTAVFDLDGTLVRGDSFALFTRRLLFRQRWRAALALVAAVVLVPLMALGPTRRYGLRALLWLATAGLTEARCTALAEEFAARRASQSIPVALDRLRRHLAAGDRVVVATACADPLASAICARLGLGDVEVVAAQLRPGRTGLRPYLGCRGPQKVDRLRAIGVAEPIDHAYTDAAVDLPLLAAARHRVLVAPSDRELDRLRAALPGADLEVLLDAQPSPTTDAPT
ncbi:haloacid dehalogenase-like hydrolase [Actinocatenispora sera]|uniref:Phosphoserine phosphatase n=1 Tax=Actinocatenispora sera TaxID=390989 RepID=A0A810LAG1_9ACTN|nr:haloacid dehalogenase-like hydrolase [Actinocatenispora sera]BCJ31865.1 phosphoserine phosphatase [Actinocatenispora sera]